MQGDAFGLVGSVIEGRYRVDAVVGEGGFGVVYRGQHLALGHPIAIKCLKTPEHFNQAARDAFLAKFREEGQMLSRLRECVGIVHVHDFGVTGTRLGLPAAYLVLEWLEGQTLEQTLEQRRAQGLPALTLPEAVGLLAPAFDALAFAHHMKIAHRDIKPANLYLARTARGPILKVLDFGIAKLMQEGDTAQHAATAAGGGLQAFSPGYAAPEQFFPGRYGASGPWTDVHALALVLVEMLTGRTALMGNDMGALIANATAEQRPTPRARGLWLPDPVERVFQQALALMTTQRHGDAGQFYEALRAAIHAAGLPVPPPLPSLTPPYGHPSSPAYTPAPAQVFAPPGAWSPPGTIPTPYQAPTAPPGSVNAPTAPASRYLSGTEIAGSRASGTEIAGSRASGGGTVPAPPAVKQAKKSPAVAILIAGTVVGALGLGAAGLLLLWSEKTILTGTAASASGAAGAAPPDGVELALGMTHGREIIAILPQAQAPVGKWHWRLQRQGGRVVKAEQVRPGGGVAQSETYEYPAGGGRIEHQLDAHGTEQQTTSVTADGVVTTTLRSGVTTYRGCNRIQRIFDAAGNVSETRCLALTGIAVVDESGCQALRATYNDQHQEIATGCFSIEGGALRPVADKEGIHLSKYQLDASNNQTMVRYLDETGAPAARQSDGCFGHSYRFDAAGNGVGDTCIDATGAPRAQAGSSIATTQLSVDAAGCVIEVRYLDVSGAPAASGDMASLALQMNPQCDVIGREQRKKDGSRTGKPSGVASWAYRLDAHGDMVAMTCFDEARRPVSCASGQGPNDALRTWDRDSRGRAERERSFKADGTPSIQSGGYPHETRDGYGDDGQLATRTFFDAQGQPTTALGKTARMTYRHDALGGLVSEAFFGVNQAPIEASVGCHEMRYAYDASHRVASIDCLGVDGQPRASSGLNNRGVDWPAGAARVVIERGQVIANVFTGPGNRPLKRVECKKAEQSCYR